MLNFTIYSLFFYFFFFFFNDPATTEIYTLSLHDALPISSATGSGAPETPSSSIGRSHSGSSRDPAGVTAGGFSRAVTITRTVTSRLTGAPSWAVVDASTRTNSPRSSPWARPSTGVFCVSGRATTRTHRTGDPAGRTTRPRTTVAPAWVAYAAPGNKAGRRRRSVRGGNGGTSWACCSATTSASSGTGMRSLRGTWRRFVDRIRTSSGEVRPSPNSTANRPDPCRRTPGSPMSSSPAPRGPSRTATGPGTCSRWRRIPCTGGGLPSASTTSIPTRSRWSRSTHPSGSTVLALTDPLPRCARRQRSLARPAERPEAGDHGLDVGRHPVPGPRHHDDPGDVRDRETEVARERVERAHEVVGRHVLEVQLHRLVRGPLTHRVQQRPGQPPQALERLHRPADDLVLVLRVVRPRREQVVEVEREVGQAVDAPHRRPTGARRLVEVRAVQQDRERRQDDARAQCEVQVVGPDQHRRRGVALDRFLGGERRAEHRLDASPHGGDGSKACHGGTLDPAPLRERCRGVTGPSPGRRPGEQVLEPGEDLLPDRVRPAGDDDPGLLDRDVDGVPDAPLDIAAGRLAPHADDEHPGALCSRSRPLEPRRFAHGAER